MSDPKKPKLIFHIGQHKTGSTSIQTAFAQKAIHVEGATILYPSRLNHNYMRRQIETFAKTGKMPPGIPMAPSLGRLAEDLPGSDADYLVLSAESMEGIDVAAFKSALDHFLLPHTDGRSIICYVRPHAPRVLSSFCENLKIGNFRGTLAQFQTRCRKADRFQYVRKMAEWTAAFQDDLIVRPMARHTVRNGSVVEDFAHVAFDGDRNAITFDPVATANESLSVEDLVLIRLLHEQTGTKANSASLRLGWEMARLLDGEVINGPRTKPALHKQLAETMRKDYLADAQEMDRRYCPDNPLFVPELDKAVETAVAREQSYDPQDYFSPAALREITGLARLSAEMLQNNGGHWRQFMTTLTGSAKEPAKGGKAAAAGKAKPAKTEAAKGKKGRVKATALPRATVFGQKTAAPEQDLQVLRRLQAEMKARPDGLSQPVLRRAAMLIQPAGTSGKAPRPGKRSLAAKVMNRLPFGGKTAAPAPEQTNPGALLAQLKKPAARKAAPLPDETARAVAVLSQLINGMLDNSGKPWVRFLHARRLRALSLIK